MSYFDVDGTLIKSRSSWQFLHKKLGTWDIGNKHAEQFYAGLISYEDWARGWTSPFGKAHLNPKIIRDIPFTDGAPEVVTLLRNEGLKVFLLSAGLSVATDSVTKEIEVDGCCANELVVSDGLLTGDVKVNVPIGNKDLVLKTFLEEFDLTPNECSAVGDDETMIPPSIPWASELPSTQSKKPLKNTQTL